MHKYFKSQNISPPAMKSKSSQKLPKSALKASQISTETSHLIAGELSEPQTHTQNPPQIPQVKKMDTALNAKDESKISYKNDSMDGRSMLIFKNGDFYEGDLDDGKKNGMGIFKNEKGDEFKGEFKWDKKEGKGEVKFKDGERYVGMFEGDEYCGNGEYYFGGGEVYKGIFVNGLPSGEGELLLKNGESFKGTFIDGKLNGKGIHSKKGEGIIYEGNYKDGERHGLGIRKCKDGKLENEYYNGICMGQVGTYYFLHK